MFNGNLIFIEHHTELAELIGRVLHSYSTSEQYRSARTVAQALSLIAETRPAVIIMDVVLPDMSILEAIPQILAKAPQAKLILLTDQDDPRYHKAATENGVHACLRKTLIGSDLVALLEQITKVPNDPNQFSEIVLAGEPLPYVL